MARKINFGDSVGESKPKITAEDFGGRRRAVGTITHAEIVKYKDKSGDKESALHVEFAEWPGKTLRCNKSMAAAFQKLVASGQLADALNEDGSLAWEGAQVPLELKPYSNPNGGTVDKPCPTHPDTYEEDLIAFAALSGAVKKGKGK